MSAVNLLRAIRLCIALNLIPFVRTCDDLYGLRETTGLPLPYSVHTNHHYFADGIDWTVLSANFAILLSITYLLFRLRPLLGAALVSLWPFLASCGMVVLGYFLSIPIFTVIMLAITLLLPNTSLGDGWWIIIDVTSRAIAVGALCLVVVVASRGADPPTGDGNNE